MTAVVSPVLEVSGLTKDYQALRPLRLQSLMVAPGDVVTIAGLDAPAAEVFVHLITGAMLPDAGEVSLFGRSTRSIADADAWLRSLDAVGILSSRAVLIDLFTILQNIAMPLTLAVDPIDPAVHPRAVALAREAGLAPEHDEARVGQSPPLAQLRAHLARAIALDPQLLIVEHPTATLPRGDVAAFGGDLARVARRRGLAVVALTADDPFQMALGGRRLRLNGATGELKAPSLLQRLIG